MAPLNMVRRFDIFWGRCKRKELYQCLFYKFTSVMGLVEEWDTSSCAWMGVINSSAIYINIRCPTRLHRFGSPAWCLSVAHSKYASADFMLQTRKRCSKLWYSLLAQGEPCLKLRSASFQLEDFRMVLFLGDFLISKQCIGRFTPQLLKKALFFGNFFTPSKLFRAS